MENQIKLLEAALKANPEFRLSMPTIKKMKEVAIKPKTMKLKKKRL